MGGPAGRGSGIAALSLAVRENHLAAFQICWCQAAKHDRCPLNILSSSLRPAKAMVSHSHSHVLCRFLSYAHTKHTQAHTRAPSWLFLAASSREHGFSWQRLHPPAASGLDPNSTEEPAGAEGGSSCLHTHLIPTPDLHSKGRSGPSALSKAHPLFNRIGRLPTKTTYPTSLQFLNSDFSKPHSFCTKLTPDCCWWTRW